MLRPIRSSTIWIPILVLLVSASARAEEPAKPAVAEAAADPFVWSISGGAATVVPVYAGARLAVDGPFGLGIRTEGGVLPQAYVKLINEIMMGVGGYEQSTADLIEASLKSSIVWRTHVAWRPFASLGLFFESGYGLVTLGGGIGAEALLTAVTGLSVPPAGRGEVTYDITATLHMIDGFVGWRELFLHDHLEIVLALGISATLGSKTVVTPQNVPPVPGIAGIVQQIGDEGEAYLDDVFKSYVHTPTILVNVAYRYPL